MTATIVAGIPASIRQRIEITEDEHWVWTGQFSQSAARHNGMLVKPVVWRAVTGEQLHPNDRVFRDCAEQRCVNPDHQHIGDASERSTGGAELQRGVRKTRWAE